MKKRLLTTLCLVATMAVGAWAQTDVTDQYLKNADLSADVTAADNGWTCTWRQDYQKATDDTHVNVVEFYAGWGGLEKTEFSLSQEVALPAGDYRLAVNAFYRHGNDGDGTNNNQAFIFAGDKTQNVVSIRMTQLSSYTGSNDLWRASNAFFNGQFSNEFDFSLEEDQTISIGFEGTFDIARCWVILGPVKLYKYTLDAYLADYDKKVAEATALYDKHMNADVLKALKATIVDKSTFTKSSQITAQIALINEAIVKANNSIALYANFEAAIENVKKLDSNLDLTAIVNKYENGLFTEENTVEEIYAEFQKLEIAKLGTADNTDFTKVIINPGFEFGNTIGWTYATSNDHGAKSTTNDTYKMENSEGDYLFNIWSSGNAISQTIEGLPSGAYTLQAVVATDGGHKVQLNANGKSAQFEPTEKGIGVEATLDFDVLDGKATIGAEGVDKCWYKVDNFRLTLKKAFVLEDYVAAYETALAAAKSVEGKMNKDVKSALDAAIAATVDQTSVDALSAATKALEEATTAAKASVEAYAAVPEKLAKMKELVDATNVYTAEALNTYYTEPAAKYEAGTLTNDEANALQDPSVVTGWHAAITCDNFLLSAWDTNPDFNEAPYYINTWSVEGENDGSEFKVPFFEYWTGDGDSLGAKTLTATLNGIEPGDYHVKAWVRVRMKNGAEGFASGITMQLNDGTAVDVTTGTQVGQSQFYLGEFVANGVVAGEGTLNVKLIVAEDNNISWLSFKNVFYEKGTYDAIQTVRNAAEQNGTVYNLAGQKMQKAVKGLYIVNGKKVIK